MTNKISRKEKVKQAVEKLKEEISYLDRVTHTEEDVYQAAQNLIDLIEEQEEETKLDECATPELFFLVECKDYDGRIEDRWLFRTNEQAKKHIKERLCLEYNKSFGHWRNEEGWDIYAEIITLTI